MTTDVLLGGITTGALATFTAGALGVAMGGACAVAALPSPCLSVSLSTAGWSGVGLLQHEPEELPSSWTRTAAAGREVALGLGSQGMPPPRTIGMAILAASAEDASQAEDSEEPAGCAGLEAGSFEAAILGCDEPAASFAFQGVSTSLEGVHSYLTAGR